MKIEKMFAGMLIGAAALCGAQIPQKAINKSSAPRMFRLTFTVTDTQTPGQKQSVSLDVAVPPGEQGQSAVTVKSGGATPHQTFECTGLHETAQGLAGSISVELVRELPELAPGTDEHIIRAVNVKREVDLALGAPTALMSGRTLGAPTALMSGKLVPLPPKPGTAATGNRPAGPQITVTATAITATAI